MTFEERIQAFIEARDRFNQVVREANREGLQVETILCGRRESIFGVRLSKRITVAQAEGLDQPLMP